MIRVLLAEDQAMVRGALASPLPLEADLEVVAEVARGDARHAQPDVALLDIEMPGLDGLAAANELHRELPRCRVLIVTTFGRPGYLRRAMEGGAAGFLLKDAPGVRAGGGDPPGGRGRAGCRSGPRGGGAQRGREPAHATRA
jgi:two-component system, NarL family, response regulator DesR